LVRVIAFILKLLAWLILLVCVVGAIWGLTLMGRPPAGWLISPVTLGTGTLVAALLTGLFWFVPLFAFGSILSLLLDIEENTRALAAYPPGVELAETPQA
jgi:hypothetical protein